MWKYFVSLFVPLLVREEIIMSEKLNNAKNLYIRGIQDGELEEVLSCYMGESYTQHSTGVGEE